MDGHHSLIERLPKAELHLHIEGTLEPALMFDLAARNGVALPYDSVEALRRAYSFSRLQDFLDLYYQGMSVLQNEADFHDLAAAYLVRVRSHGLRYAEIFFDPQAHTSRGIAFRTVLDGLDRAIEEARRAYGLEVKLIMCFLRHLDEDDALRTLDLALPYKDRILGVGLDSSELGHPPAKFTRVFRRARDEGFRLTAHAGEEGPPEFVWQALDILGVERIDHGIRAMEDDQLVQRLARDQVALTVCPLSNLKLRVVQDLSRHPLKHMLDRGLLVTINSDDPAYFGGYLNENYAATAGALALRPDELRQLARNGFVASFQAPQEKSRLLAAFDGAAADPSA
ncbi:MAG TPA: adenosine deaminase [Candidatus Udaeobacter sp.]|nr:adenosine deaminase [Candidatus Udaeobacter sp.]